MRVLIVGAGVIGSFLCHALCGAGHDVALVARGRRLEQLSRDGLVTRAGTSKRAKLEIDHPTLAEKVDPSEPYDIAFAVMQYTQMPTALDALAIAQAPLAVLVGNNLDGARMQADLLEKSAAAGHPKAVLLGFQATAGNREQDYTQLVAFGTPDFAVGGCDEEVPEDVRRTVVDLLGHAGFKATWYDDMDAYLKYHAAFVLPIAYLSYALGCDLRRATRADATLTLDAASELYEVLKARGIPVTPEGDDTYLRRGPKRALLMMPMLMLMGKTRMGELAASNHCRHAVGEMRALDEALMRLVPAGFQTPRLAELKGRMPSWDELAQTYGA